MVKNVFLMHASQRHALHFSIAISVKFRLIIFIEYYNVFNVIQEFHDMIQQYLPKYLWKNVELSKTKFRKKFLEIKWISTVFTGVTKQILRLYSNEKNYRSVASHWNISLHINKMECA